MPYKSNNDLPKQVKNPLPKHGQDIWREAFNSAEKQYDNEETAFKVAWDAVKQKYEKGDDGNWHRKSS